MKLLACHADVKAGKIKRIWQQYQGSARGREHTGQARDRHSVRKPGHDYATPGHYYMTLCVRNRDPLLGVIRGETMALTTLGEIVREEWLALPQRFPAIRLDAFTIMPNHVHGIIVIVGAGLAPARPFGPTNGVDWMNRQATQAGPPRERAGASPAPTLGTIIGAWKSLADRRCRQAATATSPGTRFGRLWQRNYHDHIVADADELARIRAYIETNVSNWADDPHYVPTG